MKVPNLSKRAKNQSGRAGEWLEDEYDETQLSRFKSRLNNGFLWMAYIELLTAPIGIFNKMGRW